MRRVTQCLISYYGFAFLLMGTITSPAQAVLNIKAELRGTDVFITYDLPAQQHTEDFTVEVFASHNNFQSPLRQVSGDVGPNVPPGQGKKILWNAKNEVGAFAGEIMFEINAIPRRVKKSLILLSPTVGTTLRLGKSVLIRWQGGDPSAAMSLQWKQGENMVKVVNNLPNTGSYRLPIEKTMKKGTYQLVLQQGEERVSMENLNVKARLPLMVKLAPLAVAGLVVIIFDPFGGKEDKSGLPIPPDPN